MDKNQNTFHITETIDETEAKQKKWQKSAIAAAVVVTAVVGTKAGLDVAHYNHTGEAPAVMANPLSWISTPIAQGVITVEELFQDSPVEFVPVTRSNMDNMGNREFDVQDIA